jgi:hypothetical protein
MGMSDYNDGKIHGWNGGECPVHPESLVNVWFQDGDVSRSDKASIWKWAHRKADADIIAFQVTKPYTEPKVIWVNEYTCGALIVYASEKTAELQGAGRSTKSVAVKYVEAKE